MLKLILRGIRANLGRLLLTLLSVVLGVSFVSGAFVLADSLRAIFSQISAESFANIDAQIRVVTDELTGGPGEPLPQFSDDITEQIAALPEVDRIEAGLFTFETLYTVDEEGEIIRPQGPPVFTGSWDGPQGLSPFRVLDDNGQAPEGDQVAIDAAQAEAGGFEVGDTITVSTLSGELQEFELSALVDFGDGGTAGAFFLLFDLPTAQQLLEAEGMVDSIVASAANGVSNTDLLAAIEAELPDGLEVVSGETVIAEQEEAFGSVIDIFGNVLLGFAVVILFVSIFIIYNTFAILVGQRTRQLGLLRSIGASGPQIRFIVLAESVIIGLVASLVGLFGGLGVASILKTLFEQAGGGFPDGPLELRPRTIIVVFAVGLVVTVASALLPAFRASRVSPLEAIRDGGHKERSLRFRIIAGLVVLVPGAVLLLAGMFAPFDGVATRLSALGVGAALTFIGVAMMSALFASQVTRAIGRLVLIPTRLIHRLFGGGRPWSPRLTIAEIGVLNAARNPQRTTATATALMIGLALISGVGVLAASLLATFDELLEEAFTADLFIFEEAQGLPFSTELVSQLDELDLVADAAGVTNFDVRLDGEQEGVAAFDTDSGQRIVNYGVIEGEAELSLAGLSVYEPTADEQGLALGDAVEVEFPGGATETLTIESIFDDNAVVGQSFVINRQLAQDVADMDTVDFVGVLFADGADPEDARSQVEAAVANFPQLTTQDNTEFKEQAVDQIGALQAVVNGLLVLSIIVAFIGIVNTMALSILERTREIGLMRAVGTTRRQLRSSIRTEAIIVSLFGVLLGIVTGVVLGVVSVIAIPDFVISKIAIPWGSLVAYVIVGAVLGLLAAFFPARRAAKLDVLDAIAYE